MGEVYRARDARLGRDVAIKILPAYLPADSDARQRFEREAQTVSSLNTFHHKRVNGETRQSRVLRSSMWPAFGL
jgi:serine/threonine protein kinase